MVHYGMGKMGFSRNFDLQLLEAHFREHKGGVVASLLQNWALPGDDAALSHPPRLRIAVRDSALHFYVAGQRVAEIKSARGAIRLKLHVKYYQGLKKGSERAIAAGQEVITISDDELCHENGEELARKWGETAYTYSGGEKIFVDQLVAANANVVDVEMALPGHKGDGGNSVAPRMDIVSVATENDVPCLNFWEVKLASNSEIRSKGEKLHILKQLQDYMEWLSCDGRCEQVCSAYRNTAGVLRKIASIVGKDERHPAIECWERLIASPPALARRIGLVIANFDPRGMKNGSDRQAMMARSFDRRGHRNRLLEHGICVIEVSSKGDPKMRLPALAQP